MTGQGQGCTQRRRPLAIRRRRCWLSPLNLSLSSPAGNTVQQQCCPGLHERYLAGLRPIGPSRRPLSTPLDLEKYIQSTSRTAAMTGCLLCRMVSLQIRQTSRAKDLPGTARSQDRFLPVTLLTSTAFDNLIRLPKTTENPVGLGLPHGVSSRLTSSAPAFVSRTSTAGGRPFSQGALARYISSPGPLRSSLRRRPTWPSPAIDFNPPTGHTRPKHPQNAERLTTEKKEFQRR